MNPSKKVLAALAGLLILAVVGTGVYAAFHRATPDGEVYFLPAQGELRGVAGESAEVSLYCLVRGEPFFEQEEALTCFLDDKTAAASWEAVRGDRYRDLRLYALRLTVVLDETAGRTISEVAFRSGDGRTWSYPVGELHLRPTQKAGDGRLVIVEHTGNGTLGSPHLFTLKNDGDEPVAALGADYGCLAPYLSEQTAAVDGVPVEGGFPCTIPPGSAITVRAVFLESAGRDVFVASPVFRYTYGPDKTAGRYEVPAGTLGIPVSGETLDRIRQEVFGD